MIQKKTYKNLQNMFKNEPQINSNYNHAMTFQNDKVNHSKHIREKTSFL